MLADLLEALEHACDDLLSSVYQPNPDLLGNDADSILLRTGDVRDFIDGLEARELAVVAKLARAREWAGLVGGSDERLARFANLFHAGSTALSELAPVIANPIDELFASGGQQLSFLMSRGIISDVRATADGSVPISVTADYLVCGIAPLGDIAALVTSTLNALDAHYDLYEADADLDEEPEAFAATEAEAGAPDGIKPAADAVAVLAGDGAPVPDDGDDDGPDAVLDLAEEPGAGGGGVTGDAQPEPQGALGAGGAAEVSDAVAALARAALVVAAETADLTAATADPEVPGAGGRGAADEVQPELQDALGEGDAAEVPDAVAALARVALVVAAEAADLTAVTADPEVPELAEAAAGGELAANEGEPVALLPDREPAEAGSGLVAEPETAELADLAGTLAEGAGAASADAGLEALTVQAEASGATLECAADELEPALDLANVQSLAPEPDADRAAAADLALEPVLELGAADVAAVAVLRPVAADATLDGAEPIALIVPTETASDDEAPGPDRDEDGSEAASGADEPDGVVVSLASLVTDEGASAGEAGTTQSSAAGWEAGEAASVPEAVVELAADADADAGTDIDGAGDGDVTPSAGSETDAAETTAADADAAALAMPDGFEADSEGSAAIETVAAESAEPLEASVENSEVATAGQAAGGEADDGDDEIVDLALPSPEPGEEPSGDGLSAPGEGRLSERLAALAAD